MTNNNFFKFWLLIALGLATAVFSFCNKNNDDKKESSNNTCDTKCTECIESTECSDRPVIEMIDSLDVHVREIIPGFRFGTPPFTYSVDNLPFDDNSIKYDLCFGIHCFYIKDAMGCCSQRVDIIVW
jgi:hypothetical protein